MGKVFDRIDESLQDFIAKQRIFFVASAPLSAEGLVNLSPKGHDSFRVLDELTVAYLDFTGSGAETIAHVRENARLTIMFCAFEGRPRTVRLHGRGDVLEPTHPDFDGLRQRFPDFPGVRAIIRLRATRISDSCGYAVPLYDYKEDRQVLRKWAESKGPSGLADYRQTKNARSLDDLPALVAPPSTE